MTVNIDPASIDSNHAERDKHLRSKDFLHVDKYPEAKFVSTSFKELGNGKAELAGDLTLRGVTKPLTIAVEHVGHGKDPWGGYRRGFAGKTSFALKDYDINYNSIRRAGIAEVYCISVNDPFVMFQWGKHLKIQHVKLLPDGNGEFTRKIGMLVKKENLGFGYRSWRYSMVVADCVIEEIFVEPGLEDNHDSDPYEVSDPFTMLNYLGTDELGG